MKQNKRLIKDLKSLLYRIYWVAKTCQDLFRAFEDKYRIVLVEDALFGQKVLSLNKKDFVEECSFLIGYKHIYIKFEYSNGNTSDLLELPIEILDFNKKQLEVYVNEQIKTRLNSKKEEIKRSLSNLESTFKDLEKIKLE